MTLWLLKNWRLVLIVLSLSGLLLVVNHWRLKASELDGVKKDLTSCQTSIVATKELNYALQSARDDVAGRLSAYRKLHPNSCVKLADPVAVGARPSVGDGTVAGTSDEFREFAAKCADYWHERQLLEQFIAQ